VSGRGRIGFDRNPCLCYSARRHSEEHMPPPEEVEMRRLWHLGELVSPSLKRLMVSTAIQASRRDEYTSVGGNHESSDCVPNFQCTRTISASIPDSTPLGNKITSCLFPVYTSTSTIRRNEKPALTRPLLRLYRIRKAVDPSLPPAVAPPVEESAEEKRLKEKVSERDTEIDRLRKEVTSLQDQLRNEATGLQDQMIGQREAFQLATETIRRDASRREQELKEELAVDVQEHLDRIPRLEARLRANDVANNRLVLLPTINPVLLALVLLLASKMQHLQ
jgi:hypothetical protein